MKAMMAAIPEKNGVAEFKGPKPVPAAMEGVISACIQGDIDKLKEVWRSTLKFTVSSFSRSDTCHPLLHAAHRLHVVLVKFLLDEGLNPCQRGTVHPYTGDCMTVSELRAISPLELINKMLFMNQRRSKKRDSILAVKELLEEYHNRQREKDDAAARPAAAGLSVSPVLPSFMPGALVTPAGFRSAYDDAPQSGVASAVTVDNGDQYRPSLREGSLSPVGSPVAMDTAVQVRHSRGRGADSPGPMVDSPSPQFADGKVPARAIHELATPTLTQPRVRPVVPAHPSKQPPLPRIKAGGASFIGGITPAHALLSSLTGGKPPRGGRGTKLNLDEDGAAHHDMSPESNGQAAKKRRIVRMDASPLLDTEASAIPLLSAALAEITEVESVVRHERRPSGPAPLEAMLEAQMVGVVQTSLGLMLDGSSITSSANGMAGWLLPVPGPAAELLDACTPIAYTRLLFAAGRSLPYIVTTVGAPDATLHFPQSIAAPAPGALMAGYVGQSHLAGSDASPARIQVSVHAYTSLEDLTAAAAHAMDTGSLDRAAQAAAGLRGGLLGLPRTDGPAVHLAAEGVSTHLLARSPRHAGQGIPDGQSSAHTTMRYGIHGYIAHKDEIGSHPASAVLYMSQLTSDVSCLAPCPDTFLPSATKAARAAFRMLHRNADTVSSGLFQVAASTIATTAQLPQPSGTQSDTDFDSALFSSVLGQLQACIGSQVLRPGTVVPLLLVLPRASAFGNALAQACASIAASMSSGRDVGSSIHDVPAAQAQRAALALAADGAGLRALLAAECGRLWAFSLNRALIAAEFKSATGQGFSAGLHGVQSTGMPSAGGSDAWAKVSMSLPIEYAFVRIRLIPN